METTSISLPALFALCIIILYYSFPPSTSLVVSLLSAHSRFVRDELEVLAIQSTYYSDVNAKRAEHHNSSLVHSQTGTVAIFFFFAYLY